MLQQIADQIDPIGEPRADMRMARNTVQIISALVPGSSEAELTELSSYLRNYLEFNQPDDDKVLTPEEAAEIKARKQQKYGEHR